MGWAYSHATQTKQVIGRQGDVNTVVFTEEQQHVMKHGWEILAAIHVVNVGFFGWWYRRCIRCPLFHYKEEARGGWRYLEERKTENDRLQALETEKKMHLSCDISVSKLNPDCESSRFSREFGCEKARLKLLISHIITSTDSRTGEVQQFKVPGNAGYH